MAFLKGRVYGAKCQPEEERVVGCLVCTTGCVWGWVGRQHVRHPGVHGCFQAPGLGEEVRAILEELRLPVVGKGGRRR